MTNIKEQEAPGKPEEIAAKEIDSYIERVEKKPETGLPSPLQVAPGQTPAPAPITNKAGQVILAPSEPPPINLPLSEPEVREGLHHKIIDAFRWLAEFCIYLIKKYPGRVFYRSDKQT